MSKRYFDPLRSLTVYRLDRVGYHAVFSVAVGMIPLDIIFRLVMIEQKAASKWLQDNDSETEKLLRRSSDGGSDHYKFSRYHVDETTTEHGPVHEPNHDNREAISIRRPGSMSGIIRLMFSGSLLAVLGATLIDSSIGASFDTVRSVATVHSSNAS